MPDNSPNKTSIAGEKDLAIMNIHPVNTPTTNGYYILTTGSNNITLWENSDKSVPITSNSKLPETGGIQVFVEGAGLSAAAAQEEIALWFVPGPAVPSIRVDTAAYTVYSIEGPSNVIGSSKFTYTATVPGGATNPEWSGTGAMILPNATDSSARVLWDSGPDIAKLYYSPAPGFSGEFDANVVAVTPSNPQNTGNTGAAVNGPVANGMGYATSPAPIAWSLTVKLSGPAVNGVERGLRFIQVGFTQDVFVTAFHASYKDGTSLTSDMEGNDYIDMMTDPNTSQPLGAWPWFNATNANGQFSYWGQITDTPGDQTKNFSDRDQPQVGVPLQNLAGSDAVATSIQFAFTTTLTVHTTDTANISPNDATFFDLGQFGWWLDYSKTLAGYSAANAVTANAWRNVSNTATNVPQLPAANTVAANRVFR